MKGKMKSLIIYIGIDKCWYDRDKVNYERKEYVGRWTPLLEDYFKERDKTKR